MPSVSLTAGVDVVEFGKKLETFENKTRQITPQVRVKRTLKFHVVRSPEIFDSLVRQLQTDRKHANS